MQDSRTIILKVILSNVAIATQQVLKLAKNAEPNGFRTMVVLTKPDLAPQPAMQQNILDLIQGKCQDLKLGSTGTASSKIGEPMMRILPCGNETTRKRHSSERSLGRL